MLIRRKGRCGVFAGNSVWSTSERLVVEVLTIGAIQVHFPFLSFPFLSLLLLALSDSHVKIKWQKLTKKLREVKGVILFRLFCADNTMRGGEFQRYCRKTEKRCRKNKIGLILISITVIDHAAHNLLLRVSDLHVLYITIATEKMTSSELLIRFNLTQLTASCIKFHLAH